MWFNMANKKLTFTTTTTSPLPPKKHYTYIEFVRKIVKFQIEVGHQMKKAKQQICKQMYVLLNDSFKNCDPRYP